MFSWIPIHEEAARALLAYENRQPELIALLVKMTEQGLNVIPLRDHPTEGTDGPLQAVDPFTFFAVFNRSLTQQNRHKNWTYLKQAWGLQSAVPTDFHAIPTLSPQNAWFFGWGYHREPQDIPKLWKLARAVVETGWANCEPALFNDCLNIHSIGVAKLTTGLFWLAPRQVLPLPATTIQYLQASGITAEVTSKATYDRVMEEVRNRFSGDMVMESHKAWLHCQAEQESEFNFDEGTKSRIWQAFAQGYPDFVDFGHPGENFQKAEIDYKRSGQKKLESLGGRSEIERRLATGDPTGALEIITKSVALNIASFQSWRPSIGSDRPEILADVLQAFLESTATPYTGPGTLLSVFDALERNGLQPAWDTLSVMLWGLRPADYFPIKISYYRELAEKLGYALPAGRPDAHKLHQVLKFGQTFWKLAEPKRPADWVDVQSFLWGVCQNYANQASTISPAPRAQNVWIISPGRQAALWQDFLREGVIGIGWDFLGDLKDYAGQSEIENAIKTHEETDQRPTNNARACWEFANVIKEGDIIMAKEGRSKIVGVGRIKSGYIYEPARAEYHHLRKVDWLRHGSWNSEGKLVLKTLTNLTPYPDYVRQLLALMGMDALATELFGEAAGTPLPVAPAIEESPMLLPVQKFNEAEALAQLYMPERDFQHILEQLRRKKNVILQGPPGVGKTFVAQTLGYALLGERDASRVQMVQFHQSYGYEEFIQGLRPTSTGSYILRDGAFYTFCERARLDDRDHIFIIDEINRGNLSKILGELMMLIEHDKRHERYALPLAYSDPGRPGFYVPPNVYILGLMNTADRSLAMVDYALRRRFAFVALKPEFSSPKFKDHLTTRGMDVGLADRLIAGLNDLNETIRKDRLDLGEGFCIGHSYFCTDGPALDRNWIDAILDYEIKPLLLEYWMEGPDKAEKAIDAIKAALS